jgi:RND family efflux transporter MFP subunit
MKRVVTILVVVALVAAGGYVGYRMLSRPAATSNSAAQTATVKKGPLIVTISSAGSISAHSSGDVSFRVSGQIKTIHVKLGDTVKAAQALAELDDSDLQLSVSAAENSLLSAQASYRKLVAGLLPEERKLAELDLQASADALKKAQDEYDKVSWRPNIGMLPQSTNLQQATKDYEKAKLTYAQKVRGATGDDLAIAQAQVNQAQGSLTQAKQKLDQAKLIAPFGGTVTSVNLTPGQYVTANAAVVTLVDLTGLEIKVPLPETDVPRVAAGQSVAVTLDALPGVTLNGKVTWVPPVATISQGVVNYPVTIEIAQPDPAVRVGMTASVSIVVERRDSVLMVPNRAVRTSGRQRSVEVLVDGQPTEVPVTLGVSNDSYTEVASGLMEGDVVVLRTTTTSSQGRLGGMGRMFGGGMSVGR